MSAESIIEMAREVELRKRERALTAACLQFFEAKDYYQEWDARDAMEAALAMPGAPE